MKMSMRAQASQTVENEALLSNLAGFKIPVVDEAAERYYKYPSGRDSIIAIELHCKFV